MFVRFLELATGVALVIIPIRLSTRYFSNLLTRVFGQKLWINIIANVLKWTVFQIVGWSLLLDPLIPGTAHIKVFLNDFPAPVRMNMQVEIAPVSFDGSIDPRKVERVACDARGICAEMVEMDWGESTILLTIYDKARVEGMVYREYVSISPYVRIGLYDKVVRPAAAEISIHYNDGG